MWCIISGEAAGEIWNWSLLGVKGLKGWKDVLFELGSERILNRRREGAPGRVVAYTGEFISTLASILFSDVDGQSCVE